MDSWGTGQWERSHLNCVSTLYDFPGENRTWLLRLWIDERTSPLGGWSQYLSLYGVLRGVVARRDGCNSPLRYAGTGDAYGLSLSFSLSLFSSPPAVASRRFRQEDAHRGEERWIKRSWGSPNPTTPRHMRAYARILQVQRLNWLGIVGDAVNRRSLRLWRRDKYSWVGLFHHADVQGWILIKWPLYIAKIVSGVLSSF